MQISSEVFSAKLLTDRQTNNDKNITCGGSKRIKIAKTHDDYLS